MLGSKGRSACRKRGLSYGPCFTEQFQPLEGERRASTVPQQPLQAVAILRAVYAAIVHEELVVRPLYSIGNWKVGSGASSPP